MKNSQKKTITIKRFFVFGKSIDTAKKEKKLLS